jgi:putative oxidoreductase
MDHVDLGLLILRVAVGVTMVLHGWNKVRSRKAFAGTVRWFESLGMRPGRLNGFLAASTEITSGVLLAVGLLTPLAAAMIIGVMVVAALTSHRHNGFFIFRPGEGWEYVMILAVAAFAIGSIGAGWASVDHALGLDVEGWWGAAIAGILGVGGALGQLAVFYRPPAKQPAA